MKRVEPAPWYHSFPIRYIISGLFHDSVASMKAIYDEGHAAFPHAESAWTHSYSLCRARLGPSSLRLNTQRDLRLMSPRCTILLLAHLGRCLRSLRLVAYVCPSWPIQRSCVDLIRNYPGYIPSEPSHSWIGLMYLVAVLDCTRRAQSCDCLHRLHGWTSFPYISINKFFSITTGSWNAWIAFLYG